jgi:hypothetical protein
MTYDIFLIKGNVIENIICIESIELAQELFPNYELIERTDDNKQFNPGDTMP